MDLTTKKGYEKLLNSAGKTPWATLSAQIYVDTKNNPESQFAQTDSRPKKFYLKSQSNQLDLSETALSNASMVTKKKRFDFLEKDLHPFLTYNAYYHLHCYTKTINHSQSPKKEFGEWLHPDMVGCYFPLDDWKQEVFELSSAIGNISIRLFSFELKREISFGNLRESFFKQFQTHHGQMKATWLQLKFRKKKNLEANFLAFQHRLELALSDLILTTLIHQKLFFLQNIVKPLIGKQSIN